jgi:hypothetical protein
MRFRRALDRGNVTEALSAAAELQFVSLAEALELTLLLADSEAERYERGRLAGTFASRKRFRTSTSVRVSPCSRCSLRFLRTGLRLRPWPSCSAGREGSSGQERFLSAARG